MSHSPVVYYQNFSKFDNNTKQITMSKNYVYTKKSFKADDDIMINFTVEFISDGNTGVTKVNAPKKTPKKIEDAGTCYVGLAKDLRASELIIVSDIANPVSEEEDITVEYKINNEVIVRHNNLKSEAKRILVIIMVEITNP